MSIQMSLPVLKREEFDHSILSTFSRCRRLAFYNYALNRSGGSSPSSRFGNAYHQFRYHLESLHKKHIVETGASLNDVSETLFVLAFDAATKSWDDPPIEHKFSYLDYNRLRKTCELAFKNWLNEKRIGAIKVLQSEIPAVVKLPSGRKYGGKIDQVVEWNHTIYIRDFKTGSRLYTNQAARYKPHHQFTGYLWQLRQLSGRECYDILVEFVYNTKDKGPEIHQFLTTRTDRHIEDFVEWAEHETAAYEEAQLKNAWPMFTTACNDFSGCYFKDACNAPTWNETENFLLEKTSEHVWDFTSDAED